MSWPDLNARSCRCLLGTRDRAAGRTLVAGQRWVRSYPVQIAGGGSAVLAMVTTANKDYTGVAMQGQGRR
jgi:hypothetical protein